MNPELGAIVNRKIIKALPGQKSIYHIIEEMRHKTPRRQVVSLLEDVTGRVRMGQVQTQCGGSTYDVWFHNCTATGHPRKDDPEGD